MTYNNNNNDFFGQIVIFSGVKLVRVNYIKILIL